ncbi:hypothetical protein B0T16DRAFT_102327 [Cercophora newfieldiana]|uniref:Uncharacterized protein n=1 Tax=Cercophora newfieldiana TaxID=92897 RepID=A0AA40CV03_9PEZI|nr:hypothetical protein B0T16DRAFT_102327 [Cercophora newfieldiana]
MAPSIPATEWEVGSLASGTHQDQCRQPSGNEDLHRAELGLPRLLRSQHRETERGRNHGVQPSKSRSSHLDRLSADLWPNSFPSPGPRCRNGVCTHPRHLDGVPYLCCSINMRLRARRCSPTVPQNPVMQYDARMARRVARASRPLRSTNSRLDDSEHKLVPDNRQWSPGSIGHSTHKIPAKKRV